MVTSGERWRLVGAAFADLLLWFAGAGAVAGCSMVVLVAVAVLWGRAPGQRFFGVEAVVVLVVGAAAFLVFLLSPYDLNWHLGTALDRLLLQLWPLTVWAVLRAVRGP